ncbi:MAG: hypothetical protein ACI4PO_08810 [Faecousia sp.]
MSKESTSTKQPNAVYRAVDRYFRLTERGTNIKTEIFAGMLMFFEVICMSAVCAQMIAANSGIPSFSTVYYGMLLVTILSTILMGLVCNAPLMQSVSMGAVVLIVSTLSSHLGLTLANVLMIALISNLIYLIVMLIKPARQFLFSAVPEQVKKALPAALGGYLLVYALTQLNLFGVTTNNYNEVLESLAAAGDALPYWGLNIFSFGMENAVFGGWYARMAIITALVAFASLTILHAKKVRHATIWSFLITLVVYAIIWVLRGNFVDYYLYAFITPAYGGMYFYDGIQRISGEFNASVLMKSLTEGFDFTKYINYLTYLEAQTQGVAMDQVTVNATGNILGVVITTVLSFLTLGVSETAAGVHGCAFTGNAYDEDGKVTYFSNPILGKAGRVLNVYAVNALSSVVGCIIGGGPVAVRGENVVGAREGGKTGLAAIVAGLLGIVAIYNLIFSGLFLDGIIVLGMLIFVALTLLGSFKNCDFSGTAESLPFLSTVVTAAVTQNLGTAVLLGIAMDTVVKLLGGKFRQIHVGSWILSAGFLVSLILQII